MIVVNDNIVSITDRGHYVVEKLRMKMNNVHEDSGNLFDMKCGCVCNTDNCKL